MKTRAIPVRRSAVPELPGAGNGGRQARQRQQWLARICPAWLCIVTKLLAVCGVEGADEPLVLPVWPGAVPGDNETIGPERVRAPSEAPTKDAKWITIYFIEQRPAGVEISKDVLAPYMRIPKETPPVFLVHAGDDPVAGVENSVVMYMALKRATVPAELHLYAQGGHGFGVRKSNLPCSTWTDRCVAWLQSRGLLDGNAGTK